MKNLITFLLMAVFMLSCSVEPIAVPELAEASVQTAGLSKGRPIKDAADSNTRKIMFEPTLLNGTFEERLASLQIVSAHASPVSINWNMLGAVKDLKAGENLIQINTIIYEKGFPTQWEKQMPTNGWRGIWFADVLEPGKTYILWLQTYDVRVEFVMPDGKI